MRLLFWRLNFWAVGVCSRLSGHISKLRLRHGRFLMLFFHGARL